MSAMGPGGWRVLTAGLTLALGLAMSASAAPRITQRINAPYIPKGFELQLTEDCEIISSGGPPDARLNCAPGLGWRLLDADGELIFPKVGYLREDTDWVFAADRQVAFAGGGRVTLVDLPSGTARDTPFKDLIRLHAQGLGVMALLWRPSSGGGPAAAVPLLADGSLGAPVAEADVPGLDRVWDKQCREAMALAAMRVERLPNTVWSQIVRAPAEPSAQAWTCDGLSAVRFAGLGADGRWRALDTLTLELRVEAAFDSADLALKAPN